MNPLPVQFEELTDLVWALANDSLDAGGTVRLQGLLDADTANRRVYIELMDQFASLEWEKVEGDHWLNRTGYGARMRERRARNCGDACCNDMSGTVDDATFAQDRSYIVPGGALPASAFPQPPAGLYPSLSMFQTPLGGVLFSYLMATVILGVAMTVAWVWKRPDYSQIVHVTPPAVQRGRHAAADRNVVGRVTATVDCQWGEAEEEDPQTAILYPRSRVYLGQKIALVSGLMEIAYDTGAKVILEGPVTYAVDSPAGGYLSIGKLTAQLEKRSEVRGQRSESANQQAEITNHRFVVRTPTAIVTDLGTEFGVEVDKTGQTFSHVFRGVVRLEAASAGVPAGTVVRVLHENESARVEANREVAGSDAKATVTPVAVSPVAFVREVPKPTIKSLDLVDLLAGGNGFSKHRDRGIDPLNGKICKALPPPVLDIKDYTVGDRKYHRVEGVQGVDGVFIPDGSAGPMTVDSAGHAFSGFPKTSNETTGYIWTGGVLHFSPPFEDLRTVLGGVDFGTPDHAILYLQSNQGITFDLDAIRRANPGWKTTRFRATAGNTERASERGEAVYADLWVLVDGQVRFRRREINGLNGGFSIVVPLGDGERFLTLATTDGGNGIGWDQVLYGDPELELTPIRVHDRTRSPTGVGGEGR